MAMKYAYGYEGHHGEDAKVTELIVRGVTDGTNVNGVFALTVSPDIVHSITNYAYGPNPNYIVIPINMTMVIKQLVITGAAVTVDIEVSTDAHNASPTFTKIATYEFNPSVDGQAVINPDLVIRAFYSINNLGKVSSVAVRFVWRQTTAGVSNIVANCYIC